MDHPIAVELAKVAPPIVVTYALTVGEYVAPWITILTFLYLILQIVWIVIRMSRKPPSKDGE